MGKMNFSCPSLSHPSETSIVKEPACYANRLVAGSCLTPGRLHATPQSNSLEAKAVIPPAR
jgi:hypothetical protein